MYKCEMCGKAFNGPEWALECEFKHRRAAYANALLHKKLTLSNIKYLCGFNWNLRDDLKDVTEDNCFTFSHWQCCKKPAYRIRSIDEDGKLYVRGKGSWSGGYGDTIAVDKLPTPHPAEELFVDPR